MTLLAKIFYCNILENELKSYHDKTDWVNFVWMQDSWMLLKSTVSHDERHCRMLTIYRCSGQSWVHSAKRWRSIKTERLVPREHQNWTRFGSCNLLLARQIWSWDQNHVHEQRQFSLLGQNFSWSAQVGHGLEQQFARNLRSAIRRLCFECEWFWMPIKGQCKTTKTRICRFVHKNNTYWGKNFDRCWIRRIFNLRLCSVDLLRHGRLPRENDGAIEFWRIKDDL